MEEGDDRTELCKHLLARRDMGPRADFSRVARTETDTGKVPRAFVERLTEAVCYAA